MNWTKEAEQLLRDVPDFISGRLRQKIEREAQRCNLPCIDSSFVKKQSTPHHHKTPAPKVTSNPLANAFPRKYAIHAGMMGGESRQGAPFDWLCQEIAATKPDTPSMAYIHVPFCTNRCHFCGFYSESSVPTVMNDYTTALIKDIRMSGRLLKDAGCELQALYFGGGTPTDLSATDLSLLLNSIRSEIPLSSDCELTVEGRLFGFDDDKVKAALDGGINRFSFGVQAFNTDIRRRVGRRLAREDIIKRLNQIVHLGTSNQAAVIIDLIYGLPGQSKQDWLDDINCAIEETAIHGLDLYQINMIPGTPLDRLKEQLPPMADLEQQSQLFSAGRRKMYKAGFERLSTAHWQRDSCERNRYNLWNKQGINCLPLGCGAGGRWGKTRFFQDNDLKRYLERINSKEKPLATAIAVPDYYSVTSMAVGQLEQQHLNLLRLEKLAGQPLRHQLQPLLEQWQKAGLLFLLDRGSRAILTEAGEFWVVNLQQLIDTKLKEILCAQ